MMKEGGLVFIVLTVSFFLVLSSGCTQDALRQLNMQGAATTTIKQFVCNPPYIQVGGDCCLDKNSNGICDRDEAPATTTPPSTAKPTTTVAQQAATTTIKPQVTSTTAAPTTTTRITCRENSDCRQVKTERVCYNDNVYEQTTTPICEKAGTPQAMCSYRTSGIYRGSQLNTPSEDCGERHCYNGECVGELPSTTTTTVSGEATTTTAAAQGATTTVRVTTTQPPSPTTSIIISTTCSGSLYDSPNCGGACKPSCDDCVLYPQTPCYYCKRDCSKLGSGWGDATVCNTCDPQHQNCVQDSTCTGCYHCVDACPKNVGGVDYYRFQGCDAKCDSRLCRQVKIAEPQSQYKDCYKCYPPACGDGIVSPPNEECEQDADCGNADCVGCLCQFDCAGYCAGQGANGYAVTGGAATKTACDQLAQAKGNALAANCRATCWASAFASYTTPRGVQTCCCTDADWKPCLNCPNQNPALIDCQTPLAQCKAGL